MADIVSNDISSRKRGRPSGKKGFPYHLRSVGREMLNMKERDALRRVMEYLNSQRLRDVIPGVNTAQILATVISQLQRASEIHPLDDIGELKRSNENIKLQIESLEQRLSNCDDNQSEQRVNIGNNGNKSRNKYLAGISKKKDTSKQSLDVTLTPPTDF